MNTVEKIRQQVRDQFPGYPLTEPVVRAIYLAVLDDLGRSTATLDKICNIAYAREAAGNEAAFEELARLFAAKRSDIEAGEG